MDLVIVLALVAFGAGAVIAAVAKHWDIALIGVGLFVVNLHSAGLR